MSPVRVFVRVRASVRARRAPPVFPGAGRAGVLLGVSYPSCALVYSNHELFCGMVSLYCVCVCVFSFLQFFSFRDVLQDWR